MPVNASSGGVAVGGGGATIASLGGAGIATQGGQINTVASGGAVRNILDDGSGNATVAGNLSVNGSTVNMAGAVVQAAQFKGTSGTLDMRFTPATLSNSLRVSQLGASQIVSESANYNMAANDSLVLVTTGASTIVVTLNHGNGAGTIQTVKKVDAGAGTVTLTPDTGTLDGAATKSLNVQNMSAVCIFDGTNWQIIAVNTGVI